MLFCETDRDRAVRYTRINCKSYQGTLIVLLTSTTIRVRIIEIG